jgi:Family of unknown function (DUF5681)
MTDKTNYDVGYRKPPKHTQWKKGQSGNPAGRPRRDADVTTLAAALLNQRIVVRKGRTTKRVTRLEHLLTCLIEKAIAGDARLIRIALDEARKDESRTASDTFPYNEEVDAEVIASLIERLRDDSAGGA